MKVAFCGHAAFLLKEEYERRILLCLERLVGDQKAELFLGGYGQFDDLAYQCCARYRSTHPNVSLVWVVPYMTAEYQQNRVRWEMNRYDEILYPDIENRPLRFAIYYRNRWMVERSDVIICGVDHTWGGAYSTVQYAKRKDKPIYNVFDDEFDLK